MSLLVTGHRCCTEFAKPQDWVLSGLLCLNFSWSAWSFVLLGVGVTLISLLDQVSFAYLFYFCLSSCGTTIVLHIYSMSDNYSSQHSDVVCRNTALVRTIGKALRSWDTECREYRYKTWGIVLALESPQVKVIHKGSVKEM